MKLVYSLAFLGLPIAVSAQTDLTSMNKWSVGVQLGAHDGMAPTAGTTKLYQIQHFGVNGRYMLNNRIGVQLGLNYDLFDFLNKPYNTYYLRTSIEGVVNAGDILHLPQISSKIGLLVHGGFGVSNMWSNNNPTYSNSEPLADRSDEMLNFLFGMTPQLKLNEKWSVNGDLSFIFHARQSNRFDMQAKNNHGAIDGYMLNLSIGVTRYFGKNKSHADWTKTQYSEGMELLQTRVQQLEDQTKDDDKDGVPNGIDMEPETLTGSLVDSKGVGLKDSDNDGIADTYDYCPDAAGPFSTNGCVDSDKDGVADKEDECPQTAGVMSNKGCPIVAKETKEIMAKALQGVQFDYRKNELLPSSLPVLDEVVKVLEDNPEYSLNIDGYTDNLGDETENIGLSKLRAQNVANYLVSKGVPPNRISVKGFGEAYPKASNDTPEGQALNRRVEFSISFN